MSITSLISPSGNVSVQDSLWHIATSNNSGQTDFKYVFDIFNGSNQLVRVKLFPEPDSGKGYFDAGKIVRNEITYAWFKPVADDNKSFINQPSTSGEIAITYNVRVGEDYSGVTTLNMASGNVTAYNWSPRLFSRRTAPSISNNWYSNRPKIIKAGLTDKILIPYKGSGTLDLAYEAYNENNTLISSGSGSSTYSSNGYVQMDIGASALNTTIGTTEITSSVKYYKVRIEGPANSDWIYVYLDCNPNYEPINLYFINQLGMFDTARFSLVNKLLMQTERKAFQKREYNFGSSSVDYKDSKGVYYESKINYGSKSNFQYKLTMNYPSDADYEWLSELITSPQIYAELEDGYYPVTITDTNYEYHKQIWGGLKAFEITIELNQTRYGFLR